MEIEKFEPVVGVQKVQTCAVGVQKVRNQLEFEKFEPVGVRKVQISYSSKRSNQLNFTKVIISNQLEFEKFQPVPDQTGRTSWSSKSSNQLEFEKFGPVGV